MNVFKSLSLVLLMCIISCTMQGQTNLNNNSKWKKSKDFQITKADVEHYPDLGVLVFRLTVKGTAGATVPIKIGGLDGAPVLGYVFPTTLKPENVGFGGAEGIVALALTSHPDFDDTPLWDENSDSIFDNDGIIWHPHWVLLNSDDRVPGGLSVKQFDKEDKSIILPPTNPGMPMFMDSPGFNVVTNRNSIKAIVPVYRVGNNTKFSFDAVAAYMQVNTSIENLPLLGVYEVYSVLSTDLSLPYRVQTK